MTARFDTKEGEGGPRHLRCIKLTAQAPAAMPETGQPVEIMRLADVYGERESDSDDEPSDAASECPSELVDAAMGAEPAPVPADLPQDDDGPMEEGFEAEDEGQMEDGLKTDWEEVEVGDPEQTTASAGDLPPGARLSKNDGIKMWRVYFKGEDQSSTWESDRVPYGNVTKKDARGLCVQWAWVQAGEDVD